MGRRARNPNDVIDSDNPAYYENREVSYFKFNLRVLSQARNTKAPACSNG